jgi:biopolymer transport protein TolR
MATPTGPRGSIRSDINVTPLVDVVLVLLIVFMVVTPMLQRGKDVVLPKTAVVDEEPGSGDPLVVSITSDRTVWVDRQPCEREALEQRLRDALTARPRPVLLEGDRRVTVGDVRRVMAAARGAGARGVRIAVEQAEAPRG